MGGIEHLTPPCSAGCRYSLCLLNRFAAAVFLSKTDKHEKCESIWRSRLDSEATLNLNWRPQNASLIIESWVQRSTWQTLSVSLIWSFCFHWAFILKGWYLWSGFYMLLKLSVTLASKSDWICQNEAAEGSSVFKEPGRSLIKPLTCPKAQNPTFPIMQGAFINSLSSSLLTRIFHFV